MATSVTSEIRKAACQLFSDTARGLEAKITKHRPLTSADEIRCARMADDQVYVTYGFRIIDLFEGS